MRKVAARVCARLHRQTAVNRVWETEDENERTNPLPGESSPSLWSPESESISPRRTCPLLSSSLFTPLPLFLLVSVLSLCTENCFLELKCTSSPCSEYHWLNECELFAERLFCAVRLPSFTDTLLLPLSPLVCFLPLPPSLSVSLLPSARHCDAYKNIKRRKTLSLPLSWSLACEECFVCWRVFFIQTLLGAILGASLVFNVIKCFLDGQENKKW